jgi:hypothetical protein
MSVYLKAWVEEKPGKFTRWEIELGDTSANFRETGNVRLICIPAAEAKRIKMDSEKVFDGACPPGIEGKPVIQMGGLSFGIEGDGPQVMKNWLTAHSDSPILESFSFETHGDAILARMCPVQKKEILEGGLDTVSVLLRAATHELKVRGKIYPWNLTVSGFDFDPRPVSLIPEVVTWFKKVHGQYTYLPIFLTPFCLTGYLLSQLDLEVFDSKKKEMTPAEQKEVNELVSAYEKLHTGQVEVFRHQLESTTVLKVKPEQVELLFAHISLSAVMYLKTQGFNNPKNLLSEAFDRMRLSLKEVL